MPKVISLSLRFSETDGPCFIIPMNDGMLFLHGTRDEVLAFADAIRHEADTAWLPKEESHA